ncbi:hypothetical protein CEXT_137581 [Caerostris extrusa]|uniref:Uncharacterized protein n=1 Tax=Caerostris extrusa TaxID=172846 RepID=A0AAV4Y851_CAEEX|nr:hypothetical protein CEXT_137581 [Caerostris extrusa]
MLPDTESKEAQLILPKQQERENFRKKGSMMPSSRVPLEFADHRSRPIRSSSNGLMQWKDQTLTNNQHSANGGKKQWSDTCRSWSVHPWYKYIVLEKFYTSKGEKKMK